MKEKEIPLNAIEQRLKQFWRTHPNRDLEEVHMRSEVEDVLNSAFSNDLVLMQSNFIDEQSFIEKGMDCAIIRHVRYMPAFWHTHEFFELLVVLNGSCENILENRKFIMRKGDICIHAPGTTHAVSAFHDDDILLNVLVRKSTFEQSFFGLMENDSILSGFFRRVFYETDEIPYLMIHTGDDEELWEIGQKAYDEYHKRQRYRKQMMNVCISALFITLFRKHEQHIEIPNIRMKAQDDNLMFILHYMESNYATVTLHALARFFNYSDRQMQRIIRESTGMSFTENIQRQKMTKATEYLLNSNCSVAEICEKTGFDSPNNFRKIFRRYYGMTPSEYRKAKRIHAPHGDDANDNLTE